MTEFYPSLWFFVFCQICLIFTSASADRSQTVFSKFNIGTFDAVWYFQFYSAPSLVLYWCLTSQWGTCWDCCLKPIPTAPAWKFRLSETFKISRFLSIERPRMHRASESPGPKYVLPYITNPVLHSQPRCPIDTPDKVVSELNGRLTFSLSTSSRAVSRLPAHVSRP